MPKAPSAAEEAINRRRLNEVDMLTTLEDMLGMRQGCCVGESRAISLSNRSSDHPRAKATFIQSTPSGCCPKPLPPQHWGMDPRNFPGWAELVHRLLPVLLLGLLVTGCSPESPPPTAEETRKVLKDAGERIQQGAASAAASARETAREATHTAELLAKRAAEETRRAAEAAAHSPTAQRIKTASTNAFEQLRTQTQAGATAARAQAELAFKEASELASKAAVKAEEQARKLAEKTRETLGNSPPKP